MKKMKEKNIWWMNSKWDGVRHFFFVMKRNGDYGTREKKKRIRWRKKGSKLDGMGLGGGEGKDFFLINLIFYILLKEGKYSLFFKIKLMGPCATCRSSIRTFCQDKECVLHAQYL